MDPLQPILPSSKAIPPVMRSPGTDRVDRDGERRQHAGEQRDHPREHDGEVEVDIDGDVRVDLGAGATPAGSSGGPDADSGLHVDVRA